MKKITLGFGIFVLLATNSLADNCDIWTWDNAPIEMESCVYSSGGSGYMKFKNTGSRDVKMCWTLNYRDGRTSKGCKLRFKGYDTTRSSEYHLSKSKLDSIVLRKFKYLD